MTKTPRSRQLVPQMDTAVSCGATLGQAIYFTKKNLKLPYVLLLGVVTLCFIDFNWFVLLAPLLIYLGWVCAAPNLNLADGFLAIMAAVILLALGLIFGEPVFFHLVTTVWLAWLGCSLEIIWRIKTQRKEHITEEEL